MLVINSRLDAGLC